MGRTKRITLGGYVYHVLNRDNGRLRIFRKDGDLSEFMQWVNLTHTQRFNVSHGTVGIGHLYQGRFKSFPIQADAHYLTVMRYIEANPLRAELVRYAGDCPWSRIDLETKRKTQKMYRTSFISPCFFEKDWKLLTRPLQM